MSLYLTLDSGEVKGNNPYQLNRTRIDPSFRSSSYNLDEIDGYDAMGEIIYKKSATAVPRTPAPVSWNTCAKRPKGSKVTKSSKASKGSVHALERAILETSKKMKLLRK